VLTCAHIIYHEDLRKINANLTVLTNLTFYPQLYGELKNSYTVAEYFIPSQFMEKNVVEFDYALLKLAKQVPFKKYVPLFEDYR
jgi:hypothetical protein